MVEPPYVRRFLDLSTGHLTPSTREMWDDEAERPAHVHTTEYGYFVWAGDADEEDTDDGWPADAVACRQRARALGCDYLLFDGAAGVIEGLTTYNY